MSVTSVVRLLQEHARRLQMEEGQALVEYALLISLIAIVAFGAVNEFGLGVSTLYSKINQVVPR
jgi:Flp pilus assembly pilin Flp